MIARESAMIIVASLLFGALFLVSRPAAQLPRWQRLEERLVRKAMYFPISCIVLAALSGAEMLIIMRRYDGPFALLSSIVLGIVALYFLYNGISWIIADKREAAWYQTLEEEEAERIKSFKGS